MNGVFEKLDRLKPVYDAVYKATMFLCKLLLIADVGITSMAVLGRYVSFVPDPAWSEEIVLTLMVYMAVLSASMALRRNAHIRMTALDTFLPKKVIQVLDILADLAVLAFGVIMIVEGWKYASGIGSKGFYTSIPTLSKFWMYFPVPLAGVTMVVFEIETFYNHVKVLAGKGEDNR
ncbi:MAG: TRAP transporter small permease [Eubacteriales bacterium]|nr:TRAP transporter small permease [Eubacteriales bacterium]